MATRNLLLCTLLAGTSAALFGARAPAFKSTGSAVHLVAVMPETLGLSLAPSAGLVQQGGPLMAEQPITITTTWNLERSRTRVVVNAYFENVLGTTVALGNVSSGLPADPARMPGRFAAGMAFVTPWSYADGRATPVVVFEQRLTPGLNDMSSRTDALDTLFARAFRSGTAADVHEGVLTLVAEAY